MGSTSTEAKTQPTVWNSLERTKLAVSILTPVIITLFGYLLWNMQLDILQRWEVRQGIEKKLAESELKEKERLRDFRLSIFSQTAPLLNEILTYHFHVGRWKELGPADIVGKMRHLDSLMHSHQPLFTPVFFARYRAFMRESFESAGNPYGESKIRTESRCRPQPTSQDAAIWHAYFAGNDNRRKVCLTYRDLMDSLSEELLLQSIRASEATEEQRIKLCPPFYEFSTCT
jgi:hypothetical protein